jgi:RNA polymerase sigma factor (TIGR02999 family)
MNDVSGLLHQISQGSAESAAELLPLVYDELRRLAAQKLRKESGQGTLQPTALVHEAYLRLIGDDAEMAWDSKAHFFVAAAEAMHRILVESARRKRSQKRGGGLAKHDLDEEAFELPQPSEDLLALNEALERLSEKDPVKAQLVKLRYFAALTNSEAAAALGISTATAERHWAYARAWLHQEVRGYREPQDPETGRSQR